MYETAVVVAALTSTAALALGLVTAWKQRSWMAGLRRDIARTFAATRETRHWLHLVDQRANRHYLPYSAYSIGADALVDVLNVVNRSRPELVLEFGAGLSTLEIGRSLARQGAGRLISVEHDSSWVAVVRARVEEAGLSDVVTVVHAPLKTVDIGGQSFSWYDVELVRSAVADRLIDVMLVDGPPRRTCDLARYPALPLLKDRLSPNATILLDDAERPEERDVLARWTREFGFTARVIEGFHGLGELTRGGV
jgi:predicted O-methyltransferase YrrM